VSERRVLGDDPLRDLAEQVLRVFGRLDEPRPALRPARRAPCVAVALPRDAKAVDRARRRVDEPACLTLAASRLNSLALDAIERNVLDGRTNTGGNAGA